MTWDLWNILFQSSILFCDSLQSKQIVVFNALSMLRSCSSLWKIQNLSSFTCHMRIVSPECQTKFSVVSFSCLIFELLLIGKFASLTSYLRHWNIDQLHESDPVQNKMSCWFFFSIIGQRLLLSLTHTAPIFNLRTCLPCGITRVKMHYRISLLLVYDHSFCLYNNFIFKYYWLLLHYIELKVWRLEGMFEDKRKNNSLVCLILLQCIATRFQVCHLRALHTQLTVRLPHTSQLAETVK